MPRKIALLRLCDVLRLNDLCITLHNDRSVKLGKTAPPLDARPLPRVPLEPWRDPIQAGPAWQAQSPPPQKVPPEFPAQRADPEFAGSTRREGRARVGISV